MSLSRTFAHAISRSRRLDGAAALLLMLVAAELLWLYGPPLRAAVAARSISRDDLVLFYLPECGDCGEARAQIAGLGVRAHGLRDCEVDMSTAVGQSLMQALARLYGAPPGGDRRMPQALFRGRWITSDGDEAGFARQLERIAASVEPLRANGEGTGGGVAAGAGRAAHG